MNPINCKLAMTFKTPNDSRGLIVEREPLSVTEVCCAWLYFGYNHSISLAGEEYFLGSPTSLEPNHHCRKRSLSSPPVLRLSHILRFAAMRLSSGSLRTESQEVQGGFNPSGCPVGMHFLHREDGSSQCDVCQAGFACQEGELIRCASGTYAPIGSGICYPCPEDMICSDPADLPHNCPFGWQRRGGATQCTPCPPGSMCNSVTILATMGLEDVKCPLGTYTRQDLPSICIPCPPGYECPNPRELPVPCPTGSSSLGGQRRCNPTPEGLVVVDGRNHLPPRPCEEGLLPLQIAGRWLCGIQFEGNDSIRQSGIRALGESPFGSLSSADSPFSSPCELEYMDHKTCLGDTLPPTSWCPAYHLKPQPWPEEFESGPFLPFGGGLSQYFVSCGYLLSLDMDEEAVRLQSVRIRKNFGRRTATLTGSLPCCLL